MERKDTCKFYTTILIAREKFIQHVKRMKGLLRVHYRADSSLERVSYKD